MTDRIELRGLRMLVVCGVLPEERQRPQPFEIDVDVEADLVAAGRGDDLEATIDYGELCTQIEAVARAERFDLMERLAERIAETVLAHPRAEAAAVSVRKLRPPVAQHLGTSGVRIHRSR